MLLLCDRSFATWKNKGNNQVSRYLKHKELLLRRKSLIALKLFVPLWQCLPMRSWNTYSLEILITSLSTKPVSLLSLIISFLSNISPGKLFLSETSNNYLLPRSLRMQKRPSTVEACSKGSLNAEWTE